MSPVRSPRDDDATSRRDFLKLGARDALGAQPPVGKTTAQPPSRLQPRRLRPAQLQKNIAGVDQAAQPPYLIDPTDDWENWALRLTRRVTMGLTPEEAQRARALGYYGYLDYQLDYEQIDDSAVDAVVAQRYPAISGTGDDIYAVAISSLQTQLQESTLHRAAFSKRQLYQRMVEFWSDHFNIAFSKVGYLKVLDDREVIRKHALGSFPALLKASAHSTAMLVYLDQQSSRRTAPNQNYARELMELHTMGVDGGYTQQDVAEVARALTGWSIVGRGSFTFLPSLHDYGAKTVLGKTIPAMSALNQTNPQGVQDGEQVLDMLLAHPSTARFIATKLLRWFLWYEPSTAMVDRVAGVYSQTNGDIKAMVRATLSFEFLQQAPAKLKRPFHWIVSALRAVQMGGAGMNSANRVLTQLGHAPFMWDTPDGYPDQIEYWSGNLLPRWNAATSVANANTTEWTLDVSPFTRLGTADAVAAELGRRVFGGEMSDRMRAQLVAYLKPAPTNGTRVREAISLALASSSFQWY